MSRLPMVFLLSLLAVPCHASPLNLLMAISSISHSMAFLFEKGNAESSSAEQGRRPLMEGSRGVIREMDVPSMRFDAQIAAAFPSMQIEEQLSFQEEAAGFIESGETPEMRASRRLEILASLSALADLRRRLASMGSVSRALLAERSGSQCSTLQPAVLSDLPEAIFSSHSPWPTSFAKEWSKACAASLPAASPARSRLEEAAVRIRPAGLPKGF